MLHRAPGRVDVREIEAGIDPLAEEVQGQRDQVHVAGALAVAEQRALDAVGPGHHRQLGGGHGGATVVVRMEGQHDGVASADVAVEPLDLVGVDVGRGHLDRGRQVQDDRPRRRRLPHVHDRLADLDGEVQLGPGEALGGVLVAHVAPGEGPGQLAAEAGGAHGDVDDAGAVQAEDHAALERGRGVVEVDHGPGRPPQGLETALDQLRPRLGEDLDRHVLRDQVLVDELAHEVEVGLGGRREPDLDLLEPAAHEQVEQPPLPRRIHRVDQRLVAVPQVHAAPPRRPSDHPGRPGPVGQRDGRDGPVELERHRGRRACLRGHGSLLSTRSVETKKPLRVMGEAFGARRVAARA